MPFYADLHVHSRYSIATSKLLIPRYLDFWARVKGLSLIATGDCIHPTWLETLEDSLVPAEEGLFQLAPGCALSPEAAPFPAPAATPPRFLLTTEISTIFKRDGRVRKNHSLVLLPSLAAAKGLQTRLAKTGNIKSDGRPILGLDVRNLLEIVLENDPESLFIPAHIWTPWFSTLGSKSGFDSIEECFTDLTPRITAVETGLSTDPAMNWCCSFLDNLQLISNSDAHSAEKLGRNATAFDCDLSYPAISRALSTGDGLAGTVDLFPQEGKYHFDGHRKCGVVFSPLETLRHRGLCPECGKPLTRGVLYRVAELADRANPLDAPRRKESRPIIPLPELLAQLLGKGEKSMAVRQQYARVIGRFGPELPLLLDLDLGKVEASGEEVLAGLIRRVRERRVFISPGFDGEFGKISARRDGEPATVGPTLFVAEPQPQMPIQPLMAFPIGDFQTLKKTLSLSPPPAPAEPPPKTITANINLEQDAALAHKSGPCRIIAGPGSGKTRVLTGIIRARITAGTPPERILALTFSNRAAAELSERLSGKEGVAVSTLHRLGLEILTTIPEAFGRKPGFLLLTATDTADLLRGQITRNELVNLEASKEQDNALPEAHSLMDSLLRTHNAFTLSDLIHLPLLYFRAHPEAVAAWRQRWDWIMVDEFQDINRSQYNFIQTLAGEENPNLVIVGDPDQAIYGFRGSDATLMEGFLNDYPAAADIRLLKSYRCPDPLLAAAHELLQRDGTGSHDSAAFTLQECGSAASEAEWIARTIENLLGGTRSFSRTSGVSDGEVDEDTTGLGDFAILCRTREQFAPISEALENHGVSCVHDSREEEAGAARLASLLRHLANPAFPLPQGVDPSSTIALAALPLAALPEAIAKSFPQLATALAPLRPLFASAGDLTSLLHRLKMEREEDRLDPRAEAVSLMTMHAAKGLEFRTVFIPGCAAGLIPFTLYEKDESALAEEARLFYVALTRTRERLFASYAKHQTISGQALPGAPSPFLKRIRKNLIELKQETHHPKPEGPVQQELGF